MLKHISQAVFVAALATNMSYAQENPKVTIPVNKTSAASGKQMFTNYCAPCHGVNGKGQGPVASQLKTVPSDLTLLSKNNSGQFPDKHVVGILQFGKDVPSHGSATMPVWGPILGSMNRTTPQDKNLRISNLIRYLNSIQEK